MSVDPFDIQKAIVTKLKADSICQGRVFDRAPDAPSRGSANGYPYCLIANALIDENDAGNRERITVYQTVDVVTRYRGKRQAHTISTAIKSSLHRATLDLPDDDVANCVFENVQVFPDPDGRVYRAVMRFRITTQGSC